MCCQQNDCANVALRKAGKDCSRQETSVLCYQWSVDETSRADCLQHIRHVLRRLLGQWTGHAAQHCEAADDPPLASRPEAAYTHVLLTIWTSHWCQHQTWLNSLVKLTAWQSVQLSCWAVAQLNHLGQLFNFRDTKYNKNRGLISEHRTQKHFIAVLLPTSRFHLVTWLIIPVETGQLTAYIDKVEQQKWTNASSTNGSWNSLNLFTLWAKTALTRYDNIPVCHTLVINN